jgi:hypothetical protein
MSYTGNETGTSRPKWMDAQYEIWFRDPKVVARQMIETMSFERVPYKMYQVKGSCPNLEDYHWLNNENLV